ncbi:MAG: hypothetical protein QXJ73_08890 [Candidatus Caldarchaeum sp.]
MMEIKPIYQGDFTDVLERLSLEEANKKAELASIIEAIENAARTREELTKRKLEIEEEIRAIQETRRSLAAVVPAVSRSIK